MRPAAASGKFEYFFHMYTSMATLHRRDGAAAGAAAANEKDKNLNELWDIIREKKANIGTRTPYKNLPAWVTHKVIQGGYALPECLASLEHGDLPNEYYLENSDLLSKMLTDGKYRIENPENAALLCVVYLVEQGHTADAEKILEVISPFFDRIRFYPKETAAPITLDDTMSAKVVSSITEELQDKARTASDFDNRINLINQLKIQLLLTEILNLFISTCECDHAPEYALSKSPECNEGNKCPQVVKGKLASSIGAAVEFAVQNLKNIDAKIARLQATQQLTPAEAEELEQALTDRVLAAKKTNPGRYKMGKGNVWVQHPDCHKHDPDNLCGWPLQVTPKDVIEKATELLKRFESLLNGGDRTVNKYCYLQNKWETVILHTHTTIKHTQEGTATHTLISCLRAIVASKASGAAAAAPGAAAAADAEPGDAVKLNLDPRVVGRLRALLACLPIRGGPQSNVYYAFKRQITFQIKQLESNLPDHEFIPELIQRLLEYDPHCGLADPNVVLGPVDIAGNLHQIPASLQKVVNRAQSGTIPKLIELGLVPSCETLASLIPQLSAVAACKVTEDEGLQRLLYALHLAFQRRRSVMLLDLGGQVRPSDIPWWMAVKPAAQAAHAAQAALAVLKKIVEIALANFPETVLPNVLIEELRSLAAVAGVALPLVKGIATDIFQGSFSEGYLRAGELAAQASRDKVASLGTDLYADFYKLCQPYGELLQGRRTASAFGAMCVTLAARRTSEYVIEAQQILTTQNLAPLFELGLDVDCKAIASRTWQKVIEMFINVQADRRSRQRLQTNVAYAWRQFVFYVSHVENNMELLSGLLTTTEKRVEYVKAHAHCVDKLLKPLIDVAIGLRPARGVRPLPLGWGTGYFMP